MSDGKKSAAEEEEREYYKLREKRLSKITQRELLKIFESIEDSIRFLRSDNISLTKVQWSEFDNLCDEINKLP